MNPALRVAAVLLALALTGSAIAADRNLEFCGPFTDESGNVVMTTVCRDDSVSDSEIAKAMRQADEAWRRCTQSHPEMGQKMHELSSAVWIRYLDDIREECRFRAEGRTGP